MVRFSIALHRWNCLNLFYSFLSFVSFDSFDLNAYTVLYNQAVSFDSFDLINNIEKMKTEMNRGDWDDSNGIKQLKIRLLWRKLWPFTCIQVERVERCKKTVIKRQNVHFSFARSKESKEAHINTYNNAQNNTLNRVKRVDRRLCWCTLKCTVQYTQ